MRRIFSTILGAFVVFVGGALIASYFGGLELPVSEKESSPNPYEGRDLQFCPSVDDLVQGNFPGYFVIEGVAEESLYWKSARLFEPYVDTGNSVGSINFECRYSHDTYKENYWFVLRSAPGYFFELDPHSPWKRYWYWDYIQDSVLECHDGWRTCGFYVAEEE